MVVSLIHQLRRGSGAGGRFGETGDRIKNGEWDLDDKRFSPQATRANHLGVGARKRHGGRMRSPSHKWNFLPNSTGMHPNLQGITQMAYRWVGVSGGKSPLKTYSGWKVSKIRKTKSVTAGEEGRSRETVPVSEGQIGSLPRIREFCGNLRGNMELGRSCSRPVAEFPSNVIPSGTGTGTPMGGYIHQRASASVRRRSKSPIGRRKSQ